MRRRLRVTLALLAAAAAAVVVPSVPAQALPAAQWGIAFVDRPSEVMPHDVLLTHQTGSWASGLTVRGRKLAPGRFEVKFPIAAVASRGIPHVTAVGRDSNGTPNYCHLMSWSDGVVVVQCQRPGGAFPEDTRFTVMWTTGTGVVADGRANAYLAHNVNGQCYNSIAGGTCTVAGTNPYFIRFTGVGEPQVPAGNLQVTAVNPETPGRRCKVTSWGGAVDIAGYVACYDANGMLVPNAPFVASYNRKRSVYGGLPRHVGYMQCVNGAAVAGPTNYNSFGPANTCAPAAAGRYQTRFPQLANDPANATHTQVTALGRGSNYCTITELWPLPGPDGLPKVDCYTNAGGRANTNFLTAFTGAP
jgi:hypothetical protein